MWHLVCFTAGFVPACGEPSVSRHDEPVIPARLPTAEARSFARFLETVAPILEDRCASPGCHGVVVDEFDAFTTEAYGGEEGLYFPIDASNGRLPDDVEARLVAFRRVRGGHRIDRTSPLAAHSPLLRVPLAEAYGGLPHRGMNLFRTPDDPDAVALAAWIEADVAETPAPEAPWPAPLAFFRDEVLGVLVRNGCFLASCHGPDAFNDLKLIPPLPRADSASDPAAGFSRAMIEENRARVIGKVSRFANLGGDLGRSRLIVKNLPIGAGGVHQRGGNIQFFDGPDDPDVQTLLRWLGLERAALAARLVRDGRPVAVDELGRILGIAFIRGPRHAPRAFFDLDPFWPGSDVWIAPPDGGEARNLTGPLFDEPHEVQSIDVRYDGRALVFSARTAPDTGFRVYQVDVDGDPGSLRQLTTGPIRTAEGVLVHHIDPVYGPGPGDGEAGAAIRLDDVTVAFASNQAGGWHAAAPWGELGEADGGTADAIIDAQRTEAPGTFTGRRMTFVRGPHAGVSRTIVEHAADPASVVGARFVLDRPLLAAPDRRTAYVIEPDAPSWKPAWDIWRMVPGAARSQRRMTFTSANERRPTMRTTGEVMFTSVRNVGWQAERPVYNGAIYRVMAGGFDYHIHGGNRSRIPLWLDSRELPSGLEIRLGSDPRGLWGGGLPFVVDHGFGVNVEPDNPVDHVAYGADDRFATGFPRFLPAQLPLFAESGPNAMTVGGRSPGGSIRDPYPLPDGSVLVARVRGPLDHRNPDADPDWDVHRLRFEGSLQSEDGRSAGPVSTSPVPGAATRGVAEHTPRPIMVRVPERAHTHQKFAWRRDARAPHDVHGVSRMPANTPAVVEVYDYPLLQSFLASFAPVGARDFREGARGITSVRILAGEPRRADEARRVTPDLAEPDPFATTLGLGVHARSAILAEIPLEPDGSLYAQVPTGVPLRMQGLDRDGMAIQSQARWFYVQPGEKLTFSIPRSIFPLRCSGCHGALTGRGADALGPPDAVTSASKVMATWDERRARRRAPARADRAPTWIDFRRDVQPILDRRCGECHAGPDAAHEPDLSSEPTKHFNVAYESLHALAEPASGTWSRKRYIDERQGRARSSSLIEKLTGRELDALPRLSRPGVPHPEDSPLTAEELATLVRWIDMGALFRGGRREEAGP